MDFTKLVIGFVIAVSMIPVVVTSVSDLTGTGGDLENTPAGTLLSIAPLILVASILGYLWVTRKKA